jgi:hypothetical protein
MPPDVSQDVARGARFFRCALQVNPFAYLQRHNKQTAHTTEDEYNSALVSALKTQGIEALCVTDHFRVRTSATLRSVAQREGLYVFHGFEAVSKDGVHFLCIFDGDVREERLERIIGECGIRDDIVASPNASLDALELLEKAREWSAVLVAAHVSSSGGLLTTLSGQTRIQVWTSDALLACSLPGSPDEAPVEHKAILLNNDVSHKRDRRIAVVNAQDASDPAGVGSPSQSCLIKMTQPSVEALRQAFLDPESRIRLLSEARPAINYEIVSISWEGGFLDGVTLGLSPHMNCLIGGRGTGKSTVIESLRALFEMPPIGPEALKRHEAVLKAVVRPGTKITARVLVHRPAATQYLVELVVPGSPVVRTLNGDRSNIAARDLLPGLEVYGQHEISELAGDPRALTGVLARFVDPTDNTESVLRGVRRELQSSRTSIAGVSHRIVELEERVSALPRLEEQLRRFEEAGLATSLKEQAAIINESAELDEVEAILAPLHKVGEEIESILPISHEGLSFVALAASPLADQVDRLKAIVTELNENADGVNKQLDAALNKARVDLATARALHNSRQAEVEKRTQALLRSLGAGSTDGHEYLRTKSRVKELGPLRAELTKLQEQLKGLLKKREDALSALEDERAKHFRELERAAKRVTRKLDGAARVTVRYQGERGPLFDVLRKVGGRMAETISALEEQETLTPLLLVARMREGAGALAASYQMPAAGAARLAAASGDVQMELEELELEHTTTIELNVAPPGSEPAWRNLDDLSAGQRATAVLLLLLLESNAPLVIDQPEDDLDNRFIYDSIVPRMRQEKHRRQLIFSTHNANIPVLGDAELIAGFQAAGDGSEGRGEVKPEHVGALDRRSVKELVEQVLEGGTEAFELRRRKYRY